MEQFIGSFEARRENGERVQIDVYEVYITEQTTEGTASSQTRRRFETASGEKINRIKKGKYQTMTGECLQSDDPNAV